MEKISIHLGMPADKRQQKSIADTRTDKLFDLKQQISETFGFFYHVIDCTKFDIQKFIKTHKIYPHEQNEEKILSRFLIENEFSITSLYEAIKTLVHSDFDVHIKVVVMENDSIIPNAYTIFLNQTQIENIRNQNFSAITSFFSLELSKITDSEILRLQIFCEELQSTNINDAQNWELLARNFFLCKEYSAARRYYEKLGNFEFVFYCDVLLGLVDKLDILSKVSLSKINYRFIFFLTRYFYIIQDYKRYKFTHRRINIEFPLVRAVFYLDFCIFLLRFEKKSRRIPFTLHYIAQEMVKVDSKPCLKSCIEILFKICSDRRILRALKERWDSEDHT